MDVINMTIQVILVADDMLLEPVLPHSTGAVAKSIPAGIPHLEPMQDVGNRFIADRHHGVKVVREDHRSVDWASAPGSQVQIRFSEQNRLALESNDSYKEGGISQGMST